MTRFCPWAMMVPSGPRMTAPIGTSPAASASSACARAAFSHRSSTGSVGASTGIDNSLRNRDYGSVTLPRTRPPAIPSRVQTASLHRRPGQFGKFQSRRFPTSVSHRAAILFVPLLVSGKQFRCVRPNGAKSIASGAGAFRFEEGVRCSREGFWSRILPTIEEFPQLQRDCSQRRGGSGPWRGRYCRSHRFQLLEIHWPGNDVSLGKLDSQRCDRVQAGSRFNSFRDKIHIPRIATDPSDASGIAIAWVVVPAHSRSCDPV